MEFIHTSHLNAEECIALKELWNTEYPSCIQHKTITDFNAYLNTLQNVHHTLVKVNGEVLGWYADFIRDNERWFLMLLNTKIQGKGIGKSLIKTASKNHKILNGWVVTDNNYPKHDGTLYKSPLGFYKKLGGIAFEEITLNSAVLKAIKIQLKS